MSKSIFYWHLWKGMPSPHSEEGERENWCDDKRMRWGRTWCGLEEEKNIIKFSVIFLLFFGSLQDFFLSFFTSSFSQPAASVFPSWTFSLSTLSQEDDEHAEEMGGEFFFLKKITNWVFCLAARSIRRHFLSFHKNTHAPACLPPPSSAAALKSRTREFDCESEKWLYSLPKKSS